MVSRKEASDYFKKHKKIHPEIVQSEILKVKELMKKLPELPDEVEPVEPAPVEEVEDVEPEE
tara:strand:- start:3812 stop:3997 length:186 start_codon:yes stop_codon:yes gene_type:complete